MHPADCPGWEYKDHDNYQLLPSRCEGALNGIFQNPTQLTAALADTRLTHAKLFKHMTPPGCEYFAGNYRGAQEKCLQFYGVRVGTHDGSKPGAVAQEMLNYHLALEGALSDLEAAKNTKKLTGPEFLLRVSALMAIFLELFFTIHPYANGNGHIGRWLVWLSLIRLKHHPIKWPLDGHPSYDDAVHAHRFGNPKPLQTFILKAIRGR